MLILGLVVLLVADFFVGLRLFQAIGALRAAIQAEQDWEATTLTAMAQDIRQRETDLLCDLAALSRDLGALRAQVTALPVPPTMAPITVTLPPDLLAAAARRGVGPEELRRLMGQKLPEILVS